jgi:hypothetical protein
MRYVKDILRLKHQNHLSVREIAGSCGLPASTVGDYLQRAEAAGLTWPLPEGLSDSELGERLLKPADSPGPSSAAKPLPDWPALHEQLRRKGVTLQLLWQEYRQAHPEGYQRSQFCQLYRDWAKTLDPVLRQVHQPGQKLFVDWAGLKVPIHHADGSVSQASLFVTGRFKRDPLGSKWVPFGDFKIPHPGFLTQCSGIIVPDNTQISCFLASAVGGIGLCRSAT